MRNSTHHAMWVGGDPVTAADGATVEVIDPSTEAVIGTVPDAGPADVDAASKVAASAATEWAATPPRERAACVAELSARVGQHADELAALDVIDGGNPISAMLADVRSACAESAYFAGLVSELKGTTFPADGEATLAYSRRVPYGVVGRIIPFNHPCKFALSKSAAPLVAGNSVLLKPSEHTSLSALRLAELARDCLPPGVFNVVTGRGVTAGAAIAAHPAVPRVAFTGGVPAGREVLRAGAETVKAVSLELGGKNPMIVFPDTNPRAAAVGAVAGMNLRRSMGQSCQSNSRVFVHTDILDPFLEALLEEVGSLVVGDPRDSGTDMGPLAFRAHHERVLAYIELGRSEGATVLTGGGRPPGLERGFYVAPTVLTDVAADARVAQEEIFGPVLCVLGWGHVDDVVRMANGVAYGLTAKVWTNDLAQAHATAHRLQAGLVWINGRGAKPLGVPFGGFGMSGLGKENSLEELTSYTREQAVVTTLARV